MNKQIVYITFVLFLY